MPPLSSSI